MPSRLLMMLAIAALGGCAQNGPGPMTASAEAITWCNQYSANASLCASGAAEDYAICSQTQGDVYHRCRADRDNMRFHAARGMHDD